LFEPEGVLIWPGDRVFNLFFSETSYELTIRAGMMLELELELDLLKFPDLAFAVWSYLRLIVLELWLPLFSIMLEILIDAAFTLSFSACSYIITAACVKSLPPGAVP
jgi:hypothetical protein